MFVIPNCAVQGFVLTDVELGLIAEHCRQRSLRIEVDREDPKARKGEILRKVQCRCRLGGAALEVRDGDDLKLVARTAAREKSLTLLEGVRWLDTRAIH